MSFRCVTSQSCVTLTKGSNSANNSKLFVHHLHPAHSFILIVLLRLFVTEEREYHQKKSVTTSLETTWNVYASNRFIWERLVLQQRAVSENDTWGDTTLSNFVLSLFSSCNYEVRCSRVVKFITPVTNCRKILWLSTLTFF